MSARFIVRRWRRRLQMEGSGAVFMMQQDRLSGVFAPSRLRLPHTHARRVVALTLAVLAVVADLQRMFRLFNNVPSTLKVLLTAMKELATKDGKDLVTDQERAKVRGHCRAVCSSARMDTCGVMTVSRRCPSSLYKSC
jgi:hypothetical protein